MPQYNTQINERKQVVENRTDDWRLPQRSGGVSTQAVAAACQKHERTGQAASCYNHGHRTSPASSRVNVVLTGLTDTDQLALLLCDKMRERGQTDRSTTSRYQERLSMPHASIHLSLSTCRTWDYTNNGKDSNLPRRLGGTWLLHQQVLNRNGTSTVKAGIHYPCSRLSNSRLDNTFDDFVCVFCDYSIKYFVYSNSIC